MYIYTVYTHIYTYVYIYIFTVYMYIYIYLCLCVCVSTSTPRVTSLATFVACDLAALEILVGRFARFTRCQAETSCHLLIQHSY